MHCCCTSTRKLAIYIQLNKGHITKRNVTVPQSEIPELNKLPLVKEEEFSDILHVKAGQNKQDFAQSEKAVKLVGACT